MMKSILLRLAPEQYQRLRVLSFTNDQPISEMIRDAIDKYLEVNQNPKPGQEWFWAEAWQKAEREAEADLASGNFEEFENDAEFLASLM